MKSWPAILLFAALPGTPARAAEDPGPDLAKTRAAANAALLLWRAAKTPAEKESAASNAIDAAAHGEYPEAAVEIASGGIYPQRETAIPAPARTIELQVLRTLGPAEQNSSGGTNAWVIRRISAKTFEAWQPERGLLFDEHGNVLNEAQPPRRDGAGREWYGAFLPDGRWITTDLWEYDRTLSFFSAAGKYRLAIPGDRLVSKGANDGGDGLIGWARSDRNGKGWIASVGSEGGRGFAFVSPDGSHRLLADREKPSALCFPRDLEPKGFYISLFADSDDLRLTINRTEAGHGPFVGYPSYAWGPDHAEVTVPDGGHRFGFLPASARVFVDRQNYGPAPETWFYDDPRTFAGWIAASPFGDAPAGGSMLFRTPGGDVVTVDPKLSATSRVRFVVPGARPVVPEKIFADLRLGFFRDGDRLLLAQWSGNL